MRLIKAGATSQSIYVEVLDSTSTTGARKTGLVFNSAGLTAYYVRHQGSATAITLATLVAANSAYSSGGFKEVDATNMPGIYRLDVPDAAIAAGAPNVVVTLKGATGMVQVSVEIQLVAVDPQDSVRAGLTALPNAAAEAAGGLYTRGVGAGQINQQANGQVDVNVARWLNTAAATPATAGVPKVAIEAAGDFAQGAADKVWSSATRTLTSLGAALVQEIWDRATSALTTVGSIGKLLVDNINATISSRSSHTAADVWTSATRTLSAFGFSVTVGTNNDKAGYATTAADQQASADELLNRNLAGGGSGGARLVRDALRLLRNRRRIAGGTLTVYQEDDATAAWTAPVTTAAGNPVSEIDPV